MCLNIIKFNAIFYQEVKMKKLLTITLLSAFILGMASIGNIEARLNYDRARYRTARVTIINRSFRTLRGVAHYRAHRRKYKRRFVLRPRARMVIRANRNSYIRFRYNGRRISKKVRRNNQRMYLR